MHIALRLTGVTGHIQHNERLADPDDEYTRLIRELTDKGRDMTDDDRAEIARLEWYGGLYHDADIGVYVPSWNIIRCIERGASITRKGATVLRALSATTDRVPLEYDGPTDLAKLYDRREFRLRKMVGIKRMRVVRVRPIFRTWALTFDAELLTDVMNLRDFIRVVEQAGRSEGLGEARKLGYGRFTPEVIT
jgi:hypothetical protein